MFKKKFKDGGKYDPDMIPYDPDMIPEGDTGYSNIPLKKPQLDPDGNPIRTSFAKGGMVDRILAKKYYIGGDVEGADEEGAQKNERMAQITSQYPDEKQMKDEDSGSMEAGAYAKGGMIDRIMSKCYSEGGKVANSTTVMADELPAEYDYLVTNDDLDGSQPEDSNEHGDPMEMARREDIVSRIMRSRAKKDKLPRPA